ncbi:MAG: hypothetical protein LUQ11_06480 [Methylococcaceae bacterium]|nr:hypothetical protein [Methylococcaceae bacterium]
MGGKLLSLVPWSRILSDSEIVVALNTDPDSEKAAWVTIDAGLHKAGDSLTCLYSSDPGQIGSTAVVEARNGLAVRLTVPAAGVVVFK